MKVIGVGIDIVDLEVFRSRLDTGMKEELFLQDEIDYCEGRARPWESYAARFAAKEAVFKALGAGLAQGMRWRSVEVVRRETGQVSVRLHGRALERARGIGVTEVQLSVSHTGKNAIAVAAAMGETCPGTAALESSRKETEENT